MRSTYKRFDILKKYDRNISIIIHFKQYFRSFIQSAVFTERMARQTSRLYVLRMIVKLAYWRLVYWMVFFMQGYDFSGQKNEQNIPRSKIYSQLPNSNHIDQWA